MARSEVREAGLEPRTFFGWRVLFTEPFTTRYGDLSGRARALRGTLSPEDYKRHVDAKLFRAVFKLVYEIVPANPDHSDFRLSGELKAFRRVKGKGLPRRMRMFFVFSEKAKAVIFLYINDAGTLRKAGDRNDPYDIFRDLLRKGDIGGDFASNYENWRRAHR